MTQPSDPNPSAPRPVAEVERSVLIIRAVGIAFALAGILLIVFTPDVLRGVGIAFVLLGVVDNTAMPSLIRRRAESAEPPAG